MKAFPLKIVTPYGQAYEGNAEEVIVRTTTGDMGILASHTNCVAPLGMGRATIVIDGKKHYGACIGGMVSVTNGEVHIVATTFEWAEDIDAERAETSRQKAKAVLQDKTATDTDLRLAEARLKRALIRKNVASSARR